MRFFSLNGFPKLAAAPAALLVAGLSLAPLAARAQGAPPAPPVTVAAPLAQKVTQWDEYTGRFEAVERVDLRPRVSGYIEQVHFRDGQVVKKGDLLFTIDQRAYEIALESARADVARARAQVKLNETEVARAEGLIRNQNITGRDLDQRQANLSVARAQQAAAEAAVKTAALNLEWTQVRAPINGRISDKRVDVGNLVAGGQTATVLTTIVQNDPINFVFDASEADYIRYARLTKSGQRPSNRDSNGAIPVQVRLGDETEWKRQGKLDFVDNELNGRSGTIRGRALFENTDQFLTPGSFGRLRLWGGDVDAMLVPDSAIVADQARKVVLTVGPENKVVPKIVTLGGLADGLRVIRDGLKGDEKVIIGGLANPFVRPGAPVTPVPGEIKAGMR
jgi:RND family efflux transporter MFP subunit